MKKYELVKDNIKQINGKTLYRIRALKDFNIVKAGDLGGYVESENNLSHEGNCWVYDNARVSGNAVVRGNALVYDNAWVGDNARVSGNAVVRGNALVCGNSWVGDNAWVHGTARVSGNALVSGDAAVFDNALVCDSAWVRGDALVSGNAQVYDDAWVYGNARVCDNARIGDSAWVCDNAVIRGYDEINNANQYMVIQGFEYPITITYSSIHIGCRDYTLDELDLVNDDEEYKNKSDIPFIKDMIELALDRILGNI